MLKDILSLILLGITISVGISTGFNPQKISIKMRHMALEALHEARSTPLPTLEGLQPVNPYGCATYECHQKMLKLNGKKP